MFGWFRKNKKRKRSTAHVTVVPPKTYDETKNDSKPSPGSRTLSDAARRAESTVRPAPSRPRASERPSRPSTDAPFSAWSATYTSYDSGSSGSSDCGGSSSSGSSDSGSSSSCDSGGF